MKAHLIACGLLALTACTQCSDKKKDQNVKIKQEDKMNVLKQRFYSLCFLNDLLTPAAFFIHFIIFWLKL